MEYEYEGKEGDGGGRGSQWNQCLTAAGGEDKHFSLPRRLIWTRGRVKLLILYDGTRNCTNQPISTSTSSRPPPTIPTVVVLHPAPSLSDVRLLQPKKKANNKTWEPTDDSDRRPLVAEGGGTL